MISFALPKFSLPANWIKIYSVLKKNGILGDYMPRYNFPDDPQFYQYVCERKSDIPNVEKGYGYGSAESKAAALIAAIAEAAEHYCILHENEEVFLSDSYKSLQNRALDPKLFEAFSESQLESEKFKKFRFDDHTTFNWIESYSLTRQKELLLPAQLVYAYYDFEKWREPIIRIPISTGAACGLTREFAAYRGLCEIIERDAYMINYLNKLSPPTIDVSTNLTLSKFKRRIERHNLEVHFVETTLDSKVNSFVAVILDKTGLGPAVSVGLGADLNPSTAIKTSAFEAVRRHISSREKFFQTQPDTMLEKYGSDNLLLKKQLLWSAPHMLKVIEPFISGQRKAFNQIEDYSYSSDRENMELILEELKKKNYEAVLVDVTSDKVKEVGLHIIKILIPDFVPLFHDEDYPYKKNSRLYNIPKLLNKRTAMIKENEIDSSHPF